ncbi:MAG: secretin N-terminal domain-containing protein [Burkholderiales bacterium]
MNRLVPWLLIALTASCAAPPPRPTSVDPKIRAEFDQAIKAPPPKSPALPDQALLPPLRMAMPAVEGHPIDSRFDLSVNNAPAQQVFLSLVSGTRYSMLLNPQVGGAITVNLKDTTVREALDALREIYGYDYRIEGTRIFVQPAGLQTRIYQVNYLVGKRHGESEVKVQSSSLSAAQPTGAPSSATPSNPYPPSYSTNSQNLTPIPQTTETASRVTTEVESDFWGDLKSALTAIVGTADGRSVVVTPQSGVVLVRAFPRELRAVERYLRETRIVVERQVMLEAKIIEVTLAEGYQSGINWALFRAGASPRGVIGQFGNDTTLGTSGSGSNLGGNGVTVNPLLGSVATATTLATTPGAVFGLAFQSSNFAALLQFLDTQGTTQVLSSPRIATLNNQKAVLKVGIDKFFVTNVSTVTSVTGSTTQQTPTVTVAPFFSGIMLDVTPQIDEQSNITLHVHPSISNVTEAPTVVSLGGSIPSITLPLAQSAVNETDTIVRVTDGNIVAIGGLMTSSLEDDRSGIPGVADSNFLLRNSNRQVQKRELVILLKPTIIQNEGSWAQDLRDTRERIDSFMSRPGQEPPAK